MKNGKPVKEYILDSVAIANQAVAADKEKNFDKARALYIEAAQRLENAKGFVPEEHAKVLSKYITIYMERAQAIKKEKSKQKVDPIPAVVPSSNSNSSSSSSMTASSGAVSGSSVSVSSSSLNTGGSASSLSSSSQLSNNNNNNSASSMAASTTASKDGVFKPPIFPVQFEEEKIPDPPTRPSSVLATTNSTSSTPADAFPPSQPNRRAFWLMRRLANSMLRGGYVSASIYVPKSVWYQNGAKILAAPAKVAFCESLCEVLRKLSTVSAGDIALLAMELDRFHEKALSLYETLSKQLPAQNESSKKNQSSSSSGSAAASSSSSSSTSSSSTLSTGSPASATSSSKDSKESPAAGTSSGGVFGKKFTKFGTALQKGAMGLFTQARGKGVTDHPYIPWLINMFEQSQIIEEWILKFEGKGYNSIDERLDRISSFFYSIVLVFVVQDMNTLLDRYMKKSRESFSRLFPKSFNHKF